MRVDILTLFPESIEPYFKASILARAQKEGAMEVRMHNIRDYSLNKHARVDDTPYGGGAGMVMQVEPIHRCIDHITESTLRSRIVLLSAKGKRYTQSDAVRLGTYEHLIFICGRYEGVDERVAQHIADEEISLGEFVLTGGELGAAVIVDSVARLLPGVLGNDDSAVHESHATPGYREHPHYTKPESYNGWSVPEVLLGGNHQSIEDWREGNSTKPAKSVKPSKSVKTDS